MKVLLIVPPFGYRTAGSQQIKQKLGFMPPVGLALLGTILDNDGHTVRILDMQVDNFTEEEFIHYLQEFNPDVISMSILAATSTIIGDMVKTVKTHFPSATIICGGVHASMFPRETLCENTGIDFLVYGEGEITFKELIHTVESKGDVATVLGVYYRKNGEISFTGVRPIVQDLDELPIPSRKFFDLTKYIPTPNQYKRLPATNMITGRGCTYSLCSFCFESSKFVREKGYRRISVNRAVAEVKYLREEFGIKEIAFWDDEFLMGSNWVEEFCDKLVEEGIDVTWSCYGKVNFVHPALLRKMRKAGCWNIFMGLESGNQELLNFIKKGQTLDMMRNAVKWAHDAGIEIRGSFILGLPKETPEMARRTAEFAVELDLDYAQFCLNTPFPGTEMNEICKSGKYGKFDESAGYDKYTIHSALFLPSGYESVDQLLRIQKWAYRRFYFRPRYLLRKVRSLRTKEDIFRYWRGVNFLLKVRALRTSEV